jgi:putative transcriptional regulator
MTNRIHLYRSELDISQKELALRAGVTRQTINYLEHNRSAPSLELAYRIARIFNRTIEDIFEYDDYKETPA